jgi:hypothetical protein
VGWYWSVTSYLMWDIFEWSRASFSLHYACGIHFIDFSTRPSPHKFRWPSYAESESILMMWYAVVMFYWLVVGIVSRILGCWCSRILHQQEMSILWQLCVYETHALLVLSSLQRRLIIRTLWQEKILQSQSSPKWPTSLAPNICKQLSSFARLHELEQNHFRRYFY